MNFFNNFLKPRVQHSNAGQISIMPDKQYYVSGELVTGKIFINVMQPVQASAIILQCLGYEKSEWNDISSFQERIPNTEPPQYRSRKKVVRHRGKKHFFNDRQVIFQINGSLNPQQYTFDFKYQLPNNIPGSFVERVEIPRHQLNDIDEWDDNTEYKDDFYYDSDDEHAVSFNYRNNNEYKYNGQYHHRGKDYHRPKYSASVVYKLKATLDINGMFSRDLYATVPLTVHQRLDVNMQPAFGEKEGQVLFCCCIPRGKVVIKTAFDKNAYTPGETANINANIYNESSQEVTMVVKLMRFLKIKDARGRTKVITDTVCEQNFDKIPEKTNVENKLMPLQLVGDKLTPSTNGDFVNCTYRYDVECQVTMAPDIEVHLPVIIYAPLPAEWGIQRPW